MVTTQIGEYLAQPDWKYAIAQNNPRFIPGGIDLHQLALAARRHREEEGSA